MNVPRLALSRASFLRLILGTPFVLHAGVAFGQAAAAGGRKAGVHGWRRAASATTPVARHESSLAAVGDHLYLMGGRGERPLEIFDSKAGEWRRGSPPPMPFHHAQAVVFDGRIYILGAQTGGFPAEQALSQVLIYDPIADRWESGAEIPEERRRGAGGVAVHDGLIYLLGGTRRGHLGGFVAWLDAFDPATGQWTALADAPRARDHFQAVAIGSRLYAAGGRTSSHETNQVFSLTVSQVDAYDIVSRKWSTLEQSLPTSRAGCSAVAVNGRLIVLGGESAQEKAHDEVEGLDVATGSWSSLPPLPVGRHGTQAAQIGRQLHILAGSGNRGGGPELNDHWMIEDL